MESRGIATVMLCTDEFGGLGRKEAASLGMPDLPIALVGHPIGGQRTEAIHRKAMMAVDEVARKFTASAADLVQNCTDKV